MVTLLDGEDAVLLESMGRMDLKECTVGLTLLEPAYMRNEENYFSSISECSDGDRLGQWCEAAHGH